MNIYIYGILTCYKKELSTDKCYIVEESHIYYAMWINQTQMAMYWLYYYICIKCSDCGKSRERERILVLSA